MHTLEIINCSIKKYILLRILSFVLTFLLVILLLLCTNSFALSLYEAKDYVNKNVVVIYKEAGNLQANYGKVIFVKEKQDDYTIDKIYSYLVIATKTEVKVIELRRIERIELL